MFLVSRTFRVYIPNMMRNRLPVVSWSVPIMKLNMSRHLSKKLKRWILQAKFTLSLQTKVKEAFEGLVWESISEVYIKV